MQSFSRILAGTIALAVTVTACGGSNSSLRAAPPVVTAPPTGAGGSATASYGLTSSATRAGSVALPSGVALSPATLVAANGFGTVPVSAQGTFTLQTVSSDAQYAEIRNASGTPLLAGWLGAQEPAINTQTTAEVYFYFATYVYTIPDPAQRALTIASIRTLPGLATIESAISAALVKNPAASPATDAGVQSAIAALVASLSTATASQSRAAAGLQSIRRIASLAVSPGVSGSGITIVTGDQNTIAFQNVLRRSAAAFVDDVSHVDASTGKTVTDNAPDTASPIPIPAVGAIGSFGGAISDYLRGSYALVPVTTAPVAVPNVAGASSTLYRVAIVGPGDTPGAFAQLTPVEQEKYTEVFYSTLLYEVTLPLIAAVLVPNAKFGASVLESPAVDNAIKDLITTFAASSRINEAAESGSPEAVLDIITSTLASTTSLIEPLVEAVAKQLALAPQNLATGFGATVAKALIEPLALVDAGIAVVDSLAVIKDTTNENRADIYMITATDPSVTLAPSVNAIMPNATVTLTAGVHPPESDPVTYTYKNTALFGHLTDGIAGHLDTFTSSSATTTYTANGTGGGTDTVTVTPTVLVGGLQSGALNLATATATVAVGAAPTPNPSQIIASVSLSPSGCQQFGYAGYTQLFTASVSSNAPANTPFFYGWIGSGFQITVPTPNQNATTLNGNTAVASLQNTATLTVPPFSMTSGLTGTGGGLLVELFLANQYGELQPVYNATGTQAYATVLVDAGAVSCPTPSPS